MTPTRTATSPASFAAGPTRSAQSQVAITLIRVPPHSDFEQGTGHCHDETEELYLVSRGGSLTMRFGDEIERVAAGCVVRVAPGIVRRHPHQFDEPVEMWAISRRSASEGSNKVDDFWEASDQAEQSREAGLRYGATEIASIRSPVSSSSMFFARSAMLTMPTRSWPLITGRRRNRVFLHRSQSFGYGVVGANRHRLSLTKLAGGGRVRVLALCEDLHHDVAVSQHALQPVVVAADRHRTESVLGQLPGRVGDGFIFADALGISGHYVACSLGHQIAPWFEFKSFVGLRKASQIPRPTLGPRHGRGRALCRDPRMRRARPP